MHGLWEQGQGLESRVPRSRAVPFSNESGPAGSRSPRLPGSGMACCLGLTPKRSHEANVLEEVASKGLEPILPSMWVTAPFKSPATWNWAAKMADRRRIKRLAQIPRLAAPRLLTCKLATVMRQSNPGGVCRCELMQKRPRPPTLSVDFSLGTKMHLGGSGSWKVSLLMGVQTDPEILRDLVAMENFRSFLQCNHIKRAGHVGSHAAPVSAQSAGMLSDDHQSDGDHVDGDTSAQWRSSCSWSFWH